MSKQNNNTGWGEILGGLAKIALVGGATYVVYKAREAYIDQILAYSTSDAIQSLLENIPGMDDNTWDLFLDGMNNRAQVSRHAADLLAFASVVREITITVNHILSKPLQQAKVILENTVSDMDDATWNIFRYVLETKSGDHSQARTLLNYADNNHNSGGFAGDLFRESLRAALADGVITSKEATDLEALRHKLNMPAETARRILSEVRDELSRSVQLAEYSFTTIEIKSVRTARRQVETNGVEKIHPVFLDYTLGPVWKYAYINFIPAKKPKEPKWYIGLTDVFLNTTRAINKKLQDHILVALRVLLDTPEKASNDITKLLQNDLIGLWQCRIDDYRLIYYPDHTRKCVFLLSLLEPQPKTASPAGITTSRHRDSQINSDPKTGSIKVERTPKSLAERREELERIREEEDYRERPIDE